MSDNGIDDLVASMVTTRDSMNTTIEQQQAQRDALSATIKERQIARDALTRAIGTLTGEPTQKRTKTIVTPSHGDRRQASKHDYPAIARWIARAKADGTYSGKALAAAFDVTESTAANFGNQCRTRGLLSADNEFIAPAATAAPDPPPEGRIDRRQNPRLPGGRLRCRVRHQPGQRTDPPLSRTTPTPCHRRRTSTGRRVTT